eukprot:TRINITY_DN5250_c0_g1_i1.p1 TRINITY_DN5250_c0_g1~~TRINITY_DN5250_c0_g1_i1.p1  ORF type:complete len:900 (+),score=77.16 TRINITY_DN5250_c0_g1_i1:343-2700(+)
MDPSEEMDPGCPDRGEQFSSVSPTCTACAPLAIRGPDRCKVDVTRCQAVQPGGSCILSCAEPYVGNTVNATCMVGNSNPVRQLKWEMPNCTCPDPKVLPEGYVKVGEGKYQCAEGYAPEYEGAPEKRCGCNEEHGLRGCALLKPCAPPNVDTCRFDVEACSSVMPGGTCEIKCREPAFASGMTIASCKSNNTNPLQELYWFPLRCMLVECADPPEIPEGYNKTENGWECAAGWDGKVVKDCSPSGDWTKNCSSVTVLTGCQKIVNCFAPVLKGLDACAFDTTTCTSIEPNSTCQIFCKSPYTGDPTTAFCPNRNVDTGGLQWTRPECDIVECNEPSTVPNGYIKAANNVGYDCAQSYTGFPKKVCAPTLSCQPLPTLVGCTQLIPCRPTADAKKSCQYQFSDCESVTPGTSCTISCKVPFVGNSSTGYCVGSNTDPYGLQWERNPPQCTMGTACPLPPEMPEGYAKMANNKDAMCARGYTGTVVKTCNFDEVTCQTTPVFSGCVKMRPCLPFVAEGTEACIRDVSAACASVEAGGSCEVRCKKPYSGPAVILSCPDGNIDPELPLEGEFTECECPDPSPAPRGYNLTGNGWVCANGFIGTPVKLCRPAEDCMAQPTLTGCTPPVPCAASLMEDEDPRAGYIDAVLTFGPALVDSEIDESQIVDYKVYWADKCNTTLKEAAPRIPRGELNPLAHDVAGAGGRNNFACCFSDIYRIIIDPVFVPTGATQIMVVPTTTKGPSPQGTSIAIRDFVGAILPTGKAYPATGTPAVLAALLVAISSLMRGAR